MLKYSIIILSSDSYCRVINELWPRPTEWDLGMSYNIIVVSGLEPQVFYPCTIIIVNNEGCLTLHGHMIDTSQPPELA